MSFLSFIFPVIRSIRWNCASNAFKSPRGILSICLYMRLIAFSEILAFSGISSIVLIIFFIAIGSGGYFGTDWGAGTAKLFFLPELHTDFAFAIFCQENGFVGATLIIALFVLLGFALWTIAKRTTDPTGFLLVSGIIFLVVGQAVANMAMVCGLLPIIGVPLSFISYGGSSMFASSLGLGLVLSVYDNECKMEKEQVEAAKMEQQSPIERRRSWQIIKGNKR